MKFRINQFLSNMEWRLSLGQALLTLLKGAGIVTSFAIPAWAVNAANILVDYSPASWVFAGFIGMLIASIFYYLYASAKSKLARSSFDYSMAAKGAWVDPLAKTYEDKRIYLNDYCLPSFPLVENKTFINCEIIGPANIVPEYGNNFQEPRYPISDAVLLIENHNLFNATIFRNCTFRQCSFQRITFLIPFKEREEMGNWAFFNLISDGHNSEMKMATSSNDLPLLPVDTGIEKPH